MKKVFNKLVRNKIPSIIRKDGYKPVIKRLNKSEFKNSLLDKVVEEAKELRAAKATEEDIIKEIGDVYEVIDALIEAFELDKKEIMKTKKERYHERGGFDKKIFLEYID